MSKHILEPVFEEMFHQAYAAFPEWLAHVRTQKGQVAKATAAACDRDLEMASALFVAGYTTAVVDIRRATNIAAGPGVEG